MRRIIRELGEFGEKLVQQDRSRDYEEAFETDGEDDDIDQTTENMLNRVLTNENISKAVTRSKTRLILPAKKGYAKKLGRRDTVGGHKEPLPAQEAFGKDENERKLEAGQQKKYENKNHAMLWKKAFIKMIEQHQ